VLAGDPSTWWQGNARDSDVRALRNDAQNWYPRMLRFGAAAQMLALLVSQASPADAAAAAECLDTIRALREKFGDLDMFKRRIPALRALAESALTLQFDTSEVAPVCRGKVEQLGGGRVRITYDFERGDELGDFELDHGYWSAWRARLPALAQPAPNLSIHARALRVRGAACLRHEWPFTSPVTVRAKFAFEGLQGDSGTTPIFFLAACDDRAESLVRCEAFGNLEARDVSTEFRAKDALRSGHEIEEQIPCEVALTVADGRAASYVDGAAACRVDAGPRTRGDVLIYVHSQPVIAFQRLVIEGVPDEDAVRAQWIEQNLSAMRL
jgi:hypothetical protein